MGRYEVTQAQWLAVMGINPVAYLRSTLYHAGNDYQVFAITWNDCQTFIERLNGQGLGPFRLPTEAEWKYACRAGTNTRFSFGDALECADEGENYCANMDKYMWWRGNRTYGSERYSAKEVGRKLQNPWGLHDMHGNVSEWCSDRWEYPSGRDPQMDPQGPTSGSDRVYRGGSGWNNAWGCRSAYRLSSSPDNPRIRTGLRLVKEFQEDGGPTPTPIPTPEPCEGDGCVTTFDIP